MYQKLGETPLKSGEPLRIVVAQGPDEDLAGDIQDLLCHKEPHWRAHVGAALSGEAAPLETRFYLGLIDNQPVTNIMTVEQHGVGGLGHVFTRPEHRRKGICTAVMALQMEDFRHRAGQVMVLGTGFESAPYWIYHSFGFRSLNGGFMRFRTVPDDRFERASFAPAKAQPVAAEWRHWPLVMLLTAQEGGEALRSASWRLYGVANAEGPYCAFMLAQKEGRAHGRILESETGAAVGWATLSRSPTWPGVHQVDVLTHPNFIEQAPALIDSLPDLPGKQICYVDTAAQEKAAALEKCGFTREGVVKDLLLFDERRVDVAVYGRTVD